MLFTFLSSNISALENIFSKYGWPGLLVAGAIAVLVYFIKQHLTKSTTSTNKVLTDGFTDLSKSMQDQNQKLLEAIIKQSEENNKTIGKVLDSVLTEKSGRDKQIHDDNMKYRMDVSKLIRTKMKDLLNRYNGDRIFILEFHNCKENVVGMPFYWADMTYEEISRGVKSIQPAWRDQEASQLIPIIDDMEEYGGYKIYTIEDIEALQDQSSILYRKLRIERGVQEAIISALYSQDNILIGLLVIEYEDGVFIPIEVLDDEDIIAQANSIATLLDCTTYN
jgi:hypothetical protein